MRVLAEECGIDLGYGTTEELRTRVGEVNPVLLKYDWLERF